MTKDVFFIDDDSIFLKLAKFQCKDAIPCANSIFYYDSSQDALEVMIQRIDTRTSDEYFEIFLDINMPGLTGFEFIDSLSQHRPDIIDFVNIYLLSSSLDPGDVQKAKERSIIKKILQKPIKKEYLQSICV
jgi:CheY-like chemotaxis protein